MNETSSEGLAMTADTSTVRAADLGSVFQRSYTATNNVAHRQQPAKRQHRQNDRQRLEPTVLQTTKNLGSADPYDHYSTSHSDARNKHITHHLYAHRPLAAQTANVVAPMVTRKRLYHHEESVAPQMQSLLSGHDDGMRVDARQFVHDAQYTTLDDATGPILNEKVQRRRRQDAGGHRYADIEPPMSHNRPANRKGTEPGSVVVDDSATRRRLRYLLDHDFDDDALYYDDTLHRQQQENGDGGGRHKEVDASSSLKKTLLIVFLVCVVAIVGVVWLLYSSGEGSIVRGFKRLIMETPAPIAEMPVEGESGQSTVAALYERTGREQEPYEQQTDHLDGQEQPLYATTYESPLSEHWSNTHGQDESHLAVTNDIIEFGPAYGNSAEREEVEQTTHMVEGCESGRRVRFSDVSATYYYPSDQADEGSPVYQRQEYQTDDTTGYEALEFSHPLAENESGHYVPNPTQNLGPASLVPGAENRSRVDMARELEQPDLAHKIALIYDQQKSKGILSNPDATAMFNAAGGAEASRYMGFTEPPEYDPSTDTTLNVEENVGKTMSSLYDRHKKKMDPLYGIHQPSNQPRLPLDRTQSSSGSVSSLRPQRRADTEPMQHIVSADENYANTQQRRKRIAVQSQAAVGSIYDKKIQQHSATSAHFVHDPATSNGIEYMNVHDQTYLGEEDR